MDNKQNFSNGCVIECDNFFSFLFAYEYVFIAAITCNSIPFVQNAVSTPNFGPVQCNAAVTYRCNQEYTIQGQASLTCSSTGQLTGTAPTCQRQIGMSLQNTNKNQNRKEKIM